MIFIAPPRKGFNKHTIKGEMTIIYVYNKHKEKMECLIDTEDLDKLIEFNRHWQAAWDENTQDYYATCMDYSPKYTSKSKSKKIYMHRFLLNNPIGIKVDHENHIGLDNRKNNLRQTTNDENTKHRKGANKNNTSGYRNVSWDKNYGKWKVQLYLDGTNKIFGLFDDILEAAQCAKETREKYYGEFAGIG